MKEYLIILATRLFLKTARSDGVIEESIHRDYYSNNKVRYEKKIITLANSGILEEHRIYRFCNGRLSSLTQVLDFDDDAGKDSYHRYASWNVKGKRRLDFASLNGRRLYFKYYKGYFKAELSPDLGNKEFTTGKTSHFEWWAEVLKNHG